MDEYPSIAEITGIMQELIDEGLAKVVKTTENTVEHGYAITDLGAWIIEHELLEIYISSHDDKLKDKIKEKYYSELKK